MQGNRNLDYCITEFPKISLQITESEKYTRTTVFIRDLVLSCWISSDTFRENATFSATFSAPNWAAEISAPAYAPQAGTPQVTEKLNCLYEMSLRQHKPFFSVDQLRLRREGTIFQV